MAAPKGNNNATKNKPWGDALSRALARQAEGKDNALNLIADQVVKAALNGEKWAIEEVGNRMDGKPAQAIVGEPDQPIGFMFGWMKPNT